MGDRYTITERVDQGGMAEVFRGVAESLQGFKKNVAIKRILPNLTKNKKFVAMFLDEARLSLHLQHANIVHVFDIGLSDSTYFIVMEYVDGANLKTLIEHHRKKNKRVAVAPILYLMLEVCKGLAYAHEVEDPESGRKLQIVHRDISPPNILISKMGEVKIVDFGLAKASSQIETTDPGVVKGKFSYLSPEAASGQEVDARADVFAVGILLWEMLTGKRLFYGETDYQTVELVRQARVPSLQQFNSDVDPELEAVVRRALARDPRDRFQHAADLQEALAQILFSRGIKVTSRDIAQLVREAIAEREMSKARGSGPQKSLIDTLIQDEMLKFTSLEELPAGSSGKKGQPNLSPEIDTGKSPLDPGSFIDTRGWAGDVDEPMGIATPVTPPPGPLPEDSGQGAVPNDVAPEIDSLQQILEPDRTGNERRPEPTGGGKTMAIAIAVVLVMLIGGALFLFKDLIFGR
jgi:serine/threonine-protein kinase